ncbi:HNH endonuclease signature motif containing protein [Morganella morganii]|uniref:HNH endonuclease signature motif containing protein n=1 Tax=Morganella morganii TaxID=582 RepID=UPI001E5C454F|nr:HNH endonuclease signature motif containing protein [Morganella morganii]UFH69705.1 HNH endonuclease [Morganella morganii]
MANWTDKEIQAVWEKGYTTQYDKNKHRKDEKGAWISRDEYGNRDHGEGWEIDHIQAKANGGTDNLSNLRPLHWKNNVLKGKGRLKDANKVTSEDNYNILIGSDI